MMRRSFLALLFAVVANAATCTIDTLPAKCTAMGCPHYVGAPDDNCKCSIDGVSYQLAQDTDGSKVIIVNSDFYSIMTTTPIQKEIQPGWQTNVQFSASSAGHCQHPSTDGFQDVVYGVEWYDNGTSKWMLNLTSSGTSLPNPSPSFSCVVPAPIFGAEVVCQIDGGEVSIRSGSDQLCYSSPSISVNIYNQHTSMSCLILQSNTDNEALYRYKSQIYACAQQYVERGIVVMC